MILFLRKKVLLTLFFVLFSVLLFQSGFALDSDPKELTPTQERQLLEEELKKLEEEINRYAQDVTKTQKEKKTLQNQISILKKKIEMLNLQVQQSNVAIKELNLQVDETKKSIDETSLEIDDSKQQLKNILKCIYEEDQKPLLEILISEPKFSDFFDNLMALETLNSKGQKILENIKNLKSYLENQEKSLGEEKEDREKMLKIQILQREESKATNEETNWLLEQTKGKESEYQKLLSQAQKRAQEIRSRIFELIGVPKAPTFGEAYEIAKYVSGISGIRPALLLAVMTQESNIGKNVGQCYLTNTETGEGIRITNNKKEPRTMNPTRDLPYFLQICRELGRDPLNTPVSCPMEYGWGGAMGPAQFIPDTWANLKYGYSQKVKDVTGKAADPWDIKDAFLAAGLYLKDLGASENEFKAVMRYFSGSNWSKWEEFYGNSVLAIAKGYEEDIKELEATS